MKLLDNINIEEDIKKAFEYNPKSKTILDKIVLDKKIRDLLVLSEKYKKGENIVSQYYYIHYYQV